MTGWRSPRKPRQTTRQAMERLRERVLLPRKPRQTTRQAVERVRERVLSPRKPRRTTRQVVERLKEWVLSRKPCRRGMNWGSAAALAAVLTACGLQSDGTVNPVATYEAYGHPFEPAFAVPAPAVVAEPNVYVGRSVMLEGVVRDECPPETCWMHMEAGPQSVIRIFVPLDAEGSRLFDVPDHVEGRRVVVNGRFARGIDSNAGAGLNEHSMYDLQATGVMVEKVRS